MRAIVYLPTDKEVLKEMQIKLAEIHADAIMSKINSLPLKYDEKIKIIEELKAEKL